MQHIYTGTSAPTITPNGVGHHFVDTQNRATYISVGITSPLDWLQTGGASPSVSGYQVQYFTLTLADETNKSVTLSTTPTQPARTLLDVQDGGGSATFGTDFIVLGNSVSWSGGPFDGILAEGDIIRIVFF
jgi:hypothetical protein